MQSTTTTAEAQSIQQELCEKVIEYGPWWHQIDLGHGIRTRDIAPADSKHLAIHYPEKLAERIAPHFPENLQGKTVIDIGACDGYFSIEASRRGAERVVAIDSCRGAQHRAEFAAKQLGITNIETKHMSLFCTKQLQEQFDLTIMMGVLYHVEDQLGALQHARRLTRGTMILETAITTLYPDEAKVEILPCCTFHKKLWMPSPLLVEQLLQEAGFTYEKVSLPPHAKRAIYLCT